MNHTRDRRTVLKGADTGAITPSFVGPVTADGSAHYITTPEGNGVNNQVESARYL